MPLDPEVAQLVAVLQEMARVCRAHNLDDWANMLDRCREAIERRDPYGLIHLLEMYAGRGSLNQFEGDITGDDNERFHALNRQAAELANRLQREQDAWERSNPSA
jgi:hypothetical protein